MRSRLKALNDWLHTHEGRKLFRYTMVSVISTGVSLVVIALVYGVLKVWTEVPSTIFGNAVAAFPSYWLNRRWAWGKTGRSHFWKEVAPFWFMSTLGIIFSIGGATLARHVGHSWKLGHTEQTGLVLTFNLLSFAIFWVVKLLIFNRLFKVELEEFDEHLTAEEQAEAARSLDAH